MTPRRSLPIPLITIVALFALMVTFALIYVTIQAGIVAMIGLVLLFLAVGGISLFFFNGFTTTGLRIMDKRLDKIREENRHGEVIAKLESGRRQFQIEPPSGESVTSAEVASFFNLARELAGVTVDKLGPNSTQLLPFNRASKEKLTPFDDVGVWQNAMKWFMQNGYAKEKREGEKSLGVFLLNGRTAEEMFNRMMN
jgi:hypothetical protein